MLEGNNSFHLAGQQPDARGWNPMPKKLDLLLAKNRLERVDGELEGQASVLQTKASWQTLHKVEGRKHMGASHIVHEVGMLDTE